MPEKELIRWLRQQIGPHPGIEVGPGDDAAVIAPQAESRVLVTVDCFVEGTHFPNDAAPERTGHKVIAASVSDIAAMGCYPLACFATLAVGRAASDAWLKALGRAMLTAAAEYDAPLAGGDVTTGDGPTCISVTVVGETRGLNPVRRSGARPGQRLFVTGRLGGSLLGRHLDAAPRVSQGLFLNREVGVAAMIDLSDGLSTDLHHIADESGVGAVVRAADIPVSEAAGEMGRRDGRTGLQHALDDGEDFELLFAVDADKAGGLRERWPFDLLLTEIGEVTESGVLIEEADGSRRPLRPGGYEHEWNAR